jgi:hypothetical protein
MSNEEAEAIEAYYENTEAAKAKDRFIHRMEHKLRRKEHRSPR